MRDLGRLGESSFSVWCSQVGLVANPSIIDKTGWDFYVQFPITDDLSILQLHKPAFECRVQVKATDSRDRKWQITLSNLRQMATALMPTFYCFLEFDNKNEVQRAFLLHVDSNLIYSILKKIHEIEQSDKENNLNKRKMTLNYDENNELKVLDGQSLKNKLLAYIGSDYVNYINEKSNFLKKCGFEKSCGRITFSIDGDDGGIHKLINLSLGLTDEINIQNLVSIEERFGILAKKPNLEFTDAQLRMGVVSPKKGEIRFKKDKLSSALVFDIDFHSSPFSFYDYRKYTKFRIVGDFFEMICEPYISKCNYNFSLRYDERVELKKLKDILSLINLLSRDNQTAIIEVYLKNSSPLPFSFKSKFVKRDLDIFDELLDKILKIFQTAEIYDKIYISLKELYSYKCDIEKFHSLIFSADKCDFIVESKLNEKLNFTKVAFIDVIMCRLGTHTLYMIHTIFGYPEEISNYKFRIFSAESVIEKIFILDLIDIKVIEEDLLNLINNIGLKYKEKYNVIYNWN